MKNVTKQILSKKTVDGIRTTEVLLTCRECDAAVQKTYQGIVDDKLNMKRETEIGSIGVECKCGEE